MAANEQSATANFGVLPEFDSMEDATAALGMGKPFLYSKANIDGATYRKLAVTAFTLAFTIGVDDSTVCYFTDLNFEVTSDDPFPGIVYDWDFGSGATPATDVGRGPHVVQYSTSGVKTITVTASYQSLQVVEVMNVTISVCVGNFTGRVIDELGNGVAAVNVRLFSDTDGDGVADNGTILRSVNTTSTGAWSMVGLTPGNYVIVMTPFANWSIVSGIDTSPDGDVADPDPNDNVIPGTIDPGVVDGDNIFVITPNVGSITGTVLDDLSTPIEGAVVNLYEDVNKDGVSDGVLVDSVETDVNGFYTFSNIAIGLDGVIRRTNLVIVLDVPTGYTILSGGDISGDSDAVIDAPGDNVIPCSVTPGEIDSGNNFVIQAI